MHATTLGRILPGVVAVLVVGLAALAAQGANQKSALVTVLADAASPTKDLTARDFLVREDKAEREVLLAELATDPLSISLLVDTSQPAPGASPPTRDLRVGLSTFVKTIQSASPDAQISLMECAGAAVTTLDFTASGTELDAKVQRLFPNQQSTAVLLEALTEAGRKLAARPAPRRAIVSVDFRSPEASGEQAMKKAAEEVRKAGATVWAISIGKSSSAPAREAALNTVTQSSGGMRLTAFEPSALEGLLKQVAHSLLSQYTVTFARRDSSPMKGVTFATTRGGKVLLSPWMR